MDQRVRPANECDMRCQLAYLPVWQWCKDDCVCVCQGKNHSLYEFWAKAENREKYQSERI